MPRSSRSHALLSDAALRSLAALGERLKQARLVRNWTQADTAQKTGLSVSSVKKVEAGSAHITVAAYIAVLDVFGLPTATDRLLAPGDDTIGDALSSRGGRQRARSESQEWDV